jgi:hypothetical protein
MDRDELRSHLDAAGRISHARLLNARIMGAYWPGGPEDRLERAGLVWLRRRRPPGEPTAIPVCSCLAGRCAVCN